MLTTLALIALVSFDQTPLRASPRENAQQQTTLWQGDALEIRGQVADYLQVYDHRRERAGYVKATQVRDISLKEEQAPDYLAVVNFLKDTPGKEALGISYAAAYLKATPANKINADIFDAIGTMAERLANRASAQTNNLNSNNSNASNVNNSTVAAHLDVIAEYGIKMKSFDTDNNIKICYEGESFRRVLAMDASDEQKARAALAVTRSDCIDPQTKPTDRAELDHWRAEVLDKIQLTQLPDYLRNRIHMRRALVWSAIAFELSRKNNASAETAANRAQQELAAVNKNAFTDGDFATYQDAGLRTGASRFAVANTIAEKNLPKNNLSNANAKSSEPAHVISMAGETGETCVLLIDGQHPQENPLLKRCTYSQVWMNSQRINTNHTQITLAIQPLEAWRELWVFHNTAQGWLLDVLPPSTENPELGVIEFAGFIPNTEKILVARDIKIANRFKQSFEVLNLQSLATEKSADKPESLSTFYRWQEAQWKQGTLILR